MPRPRKPLPADAPPARRARGSGSVRYIARLKSWAAIPPRTIDQKRRPVYGFATRELAEQHLAGLLAPAETKAATRAATPTGVYLARWHEQHAPAWPASTARKYAERLAHADGIAATPLAELRPEHVRRVVAELQAAKLAPRTIGAVVGVLRQALAVAVEDRILAHNPAQGVRAPRVPRTEPPHWTPEQIDSFLEAAVGHRFELLFRLALTLGLRNGEVRALRREDIDLTRGRLHVRRASSDDDRRRIGPPKNRKERWIRLPSLLAELLADHLARQNPASPWLWPSGDWPYAGDTVRSDFERVRLEANAGLRRERLPELPPLTFHGARHSSATYLLALGIEPQQVAAILGHHSPAFTFDRYARVSEAMAEAAAERLDAALRKRQRAP